MTFAKSLACRGCGEEYPIQPLNVCEFCFGPLEISYDYDAMARHVTRERIESGPPTMWRYHDFLPVNDASALDMGTGFTPLIKADNLGRMLGLENLYIKNDAVNPTYSFKDRPVGVTASKALEFEFETFACVSTGNLMGSVAAHGAKAGLDTKVFFPANLEHSKIVGAAVYGATLVAIDGTYDQVNRLGSELADNHHWAVVNINMRPFYAEGSKTLGYEVAEQLGWKAPQHCVVPAASGELHTKIWKGLQEMQDVGLIDNVRTRMHLAQAEGCSPIVTAFPERRVYRSAGHPQHHRQVACHRQSCRRHLLAGGSRRDERDCRRLSRRGSRRRYKTPRRDRRAVHRDRGRGRDLVPQAPCRAGQDQRRRGDGGLRNGQRPQDA